MGGISINSATVAWFSGTGGARRVAEAFQTELESFGASVRMERIPSPKGEVPETKPDLLVLVFAVHAFDAPAPVYGWIGTRDLTGMRTAVVSVSGGGEKWPNTGCRAGVIAALEARGAAVAYETMIVMPCNWVFPETDEQAMHLMRCMPRKVKKAADAIRLGETRRTKGRRGFMRSWVTRQEKSHAAEFPKTVTVGTACTGCGVCAKGCMMDNISIEDGRPAFGDACVMCFRCVYACPKGAMTSNNFMVLKQGFDIDAVEKRMAGKPLPPAAKCFKGVFWKAVRRYIEDADGY